MDKIKALLVKSGCNQDLVEGICNVLDNYKSTIREQFEADYNHKIEQAKKVCLEETEAHKRELARRLQIFCETKAAAIESQLAKQSAHSETEAVARLRNIASVMEGIEPNSDNHGPATVVIEKAKQKIQQVNEERARAIATANRHVAISEKALKANRQLATEVAQLKRRLANVVTESRRPAQVRIDKGRRPQKPSTTRSTILENQQARRIRQRPPTGVDEIADRIDELI